MTMPYDVLLVCRRFNVMVSYLPYDGLTPIESHLLRAVVVRADTLEALAEHLRLTLPIVLDACVDLLGAGLLEIAADGQLIVSDVVRDRMGDPLQPREGWEMSFATAAAPEPQSVTLLQETVTGAVFRAASRAPFEQMGLPRLPPSPELSSVEELSPADLLFAVLARPPRVEENAGEDRPALNAPVRADARIGEVRLQRLTGAVNGLGAVDVGNQLLPVQLAAQQVDDGPPRFQLLGPSTIPAVVRRKIATGLGDLWNREIARKSGQFFDRIANALGSAPLEVEPYLNDPFLDVLELEREVEEHTKAPTAAAHERLSGLENTTSESVEWAAQCTATVDLVVGARAHHEAFKRALVDAKQQVVLACPWVKRLAVQSVRDQIAAAVSRGVLVCLLWGIERGEKLDESTQQFLQSVARHESGGGVIVSDRSTVSHAKVIACDHDWLIVSSCNFLSSGPERMTDEVGIRLTSPPPRVDPDPNDARIAPSHSMSKILRWVRDIVPDFRLRQRIIDSPALLGMAERSRRPPIVVEILPPVLDVPISVQLWARAFRQRATALRKQLERARPIALPVRDLEHREILLYAVECAAKRLYLESPDIGAAGLSQPVINDLKRARARGVDVRLRYHERAIAGEEGDAAWRSLAEVGVVVAKVDTHAKLLVCDDWIVVGSFNFLSFAGRGRHELGIRVFDGDLADQLSSRFTTA